jgi:outer membrane protein assembly factor BamA
MAKGLMNSIFDYRCLAVLATVLIGLILIPTICSANEVQTDSSTVRDPVRPKKTVAEKILKVPGEILKLPVYVVKGIAKGAIYVAYETSLRGLFDINNPAKPFYPLAGYGSNQGFKGGMGVRFKNLIVAGDKLRVKGTYSTHHYQSYRVIYNGQRLFGENSDFHFRAEYRKRPEESFYGIGNKSVVDNETNLTLERSRIIAEPTWSPFPDLSVGLILGFSAINTFDGRDESSEGNLDKIEQKFSLTSDYFRSTRFVTIGGNLSYNWTDNEGQPSKGGRGRFMASLNKGTGQSDDLDFFVTRIDLGGYLNLFKKRIIALRILAQSIDQTDDAVTVPLYLLSTLGGGDDLRGYRSFRFVGRDMAMMTLEYRYPLWRIIDAFFFLDEGHVFDDVVDDFDFKSWHTDYGFGLRVWNKDGVILLTQIAFSDETTRFYLELGAEW